MVIVGTLIKIQKKQCAISKESKDEKIMENQQILKTPIIRNGKEAAVGFCPEIWKSWS